MHSLPVAKSPLASIANPIPNPNPNNTNQILLFYVTENGRTGLQKYNPDNEEDTIVQFADNGVSKSDGIVYPASFSALLYDGLLNVYGLVNDPISSPSGCHPAPAGYKRIAQLSPVYKILGENIKATGTALATTIDSSNVGWVYYIGMGRVITEAKLGWEETINSKTNPLSSRPVHKETKLAAAYDTRLKKRVIIYQGPNDQVCSIDSSGSSYHEIGSATSTEGGTGLALVSIKTNVGVKLYLYYFDDANKLTRSIRDEEGNWGKIDGIEGPLRADENASLTATYVKRFAGEDKKEYYRIAVFYKSLKGQTNPYVWTDDVEVNAK